MTPEKLLADIRQELNAAICNAEALARQLRDATTVSTNKSAQVAEMTLVDKHMREQRNNVRRIIGASFGESVEGAAARVMKELEEARAANKMRRVEHDCSTFAIERASYEAVRQLVLTALDLGVASRDSEWSDIIRAATDRLRSQYPEVFSVRKGKMFLNLDELGTLPLEEVVSRLRRLETIDRMLRDVMPAARIDDDLQKR